MISATRYRRPDSDGGAESADKAFWISFADLMTALMVLFLMVMAGAPRLHPCNTMSIAQAAPDLSEWVGECPMLRQAGCQNRQM